MIMQLIQMAILILTPQALRDLLCLPNGMTFIEARSPFDTPGVMEIKVEGAGWETPEGASIQRADAAIVTKRENGTLDIDWRVPT